MKQLSILGCGWLGLPLAKTFISKGYSVKGSTTSSSKLHTLQNAGIIPFHFELPDSSIDPSFFESDYLVINIPPRTRSKGPDAHFSEIISLIPQIPSQIKVIYISATSVYPDIDEKITEENEVDRNSDRSKALWQVEELLKSKLADQLTIIRMGGLLGYDRIPGKYFSGKKVENGGQKVNYIHRDDAVGLIIKVVEEESFDELYNGVAPLHPTREEVFLQNAKELGFMPPEFDEKPSTLTQRFISGAKIEHKLDYSFLYPDPLSFYYSN
ncbi:epimerase [Marivirga lumbricoides]|uniref:Epimerase n=1 Tax=Marivirga lumbricoides TaxID=1046115 RepID=A0ABQ1LRB4_9BACT|nr:epimerase [Marivirga lumbricoides]